MKESLSIMLSMIALNVAKSSLSNKGISIELTQVAECTISVVSEIVTLILLIPMGGTTLLPVQNLRKYLLPKSK